MYKVIQNFAGSENGVNIRSFIVGEIVNIDKSLAEIALLNNWIEIMAIEPKEKKVIEPKLKKDKK
jgi:hypothetical protein